MSNNAQPNIIDVKQIKTISLCVIKYDSKDCYGRERERETQKHVCTHDYYFGVIWDTIGSSGRIVQKAFKGKSKNWLSLLSF